MLFVRAASQRERSLGYWTPAFAWVPPPGFCQAYGLQLSSIAPSSSAITLPGVHLGFLNTPSGQWLRSVTGNRLASFTSSVICLFGSARFFYWTDFGITSRPGAIAAAFTFLNGYFGPYQPVSSYGPRYLLYGSDLVLVFLGRTSLGRTEAALRWASGIYVENCADAAGGLSRLEGSMRMVLPPQRFGNAVAIHAQFWMA